MKKVMAWIVVLLMFFAITPLTNQVLAADNSNVVLVNGTKLNLDVEPTIVGGRMLVPLKAIFEALGGTIKWNGATNSIKGTKGDTTIELQIDNKEAFVNGKPVTLDVPAMIINQRTMVPLRFISENMGASVVWDEATSTVSIIFTDESLKNVKEILVGADLELTGSQDGIGNSELRGITLALNEINAKGGISGVPIRLIQGDNHSDSAKAKQVASDLIAQNKIAALIAPGTSSNHMPTIPVATQNSIPMISASATGSYTTVDANGMVFSYVFRTPFTDAAEGVLAANFAKNSLQAKKAAIYYQDDAAFSKTVTNTFTTSFTANGGSVIYTDTYQNDNLETNVTAVLQKIIAAAPDVLLVPSYGYQGAVITKAARQLGFSKPIIGTDGWDYGFASNVGIDDLSNTYYITNFCPTDPSPYTVQFVKNYMRVYGNAPGTFEALGYDTMNLVADAIGRAKSVDPVKVRNALETTTIFPGVTGVITSYNSNHDALKPGIVVTFDTRGNLIFKERINP